MAMEDNIKQTNFRVDQQTAEEFRAFCKEMGFSQAQGFDHLIELVELDKAKSVVSARATEIEDFEQHTKALVSAYLRSIELNENAEARVRDQFESALKSKDSVIVDLQGKIEELKAHDIELEEVKKELAAVQKEKGSIQEEVEFWKEQVNKAEEKASDKGRQIALLTEKLEQIEGADKENKELKAAAAKMQSKIQELENIIADQKNAEKEAALTAKIELSDALRKQDTDIAKLTAKVELLEQQKKEAAEKAEAQQKEIIELKAEVQQKIAEATEAEKKAAEAAKKVEAPQRKRTQKKTEE